MIVVWRLLNKCNLSCAFCCYDKRLHFARSEVSPDEVARFISVLADYRQKTGDPVLLSWLGGEPFLWQPLTTLTLTARTAGLEVSATTNGTTLGSAQLRQHILSNYKELTISIDGFSHFHDVSRGWKGGFDKLKVWVSALANEAAKECSKLKLRANVVLMQDNIEELAGLCREVSDWGISEITFNQLGGRDRPEFYPDHRLLPQQAQGLRETVSLLRKELRMVGVDLVGGEAYLQRIERSTIGATFPVDHCGPGENFLFIDERGKVSPCAFTGQDYAVDLAGLRDAADILALPRFYAHQQKFRRSSHCDDCLSTQFCDKFAAA